jgi:hypothetical protein
MKDLNDILDELDSINTKKNTPPMKDLIKKIMRRHEFYEKGDIDKIIEKSSEEISEMINHMITSLYNSRSEN